MNRNPYRAELYSILAALTVLLKAESRSSDYAGGTATLISDCQKGLKNALSPGPAGVKEATQDEYDLILEIRYKRGLLKTQVTPLWVCGHQEIPDYSGEQARNAEAHQLAVSRLRAEAAEVTPIVLAPTTGKATVFFNNRVITAVLPQQIKANLHYDNLKANC